MQWDVRLEQLNLNSMKRIVHGGAPCYLTESFNMVSQVHDVETRHRTLSVSLPSDQKLLNLMASNHGNPENKEIKRIIIF